MEALPWLNAAARKMKYNLAGGIEMRHRVTLIPGDGTGPELMDVAVKVLEATGVEFDWDVQEEKAARRRARKAVMCKRDKMEGN